MDKCIRCGNLKKPEAGAYDEPGKPSCAKCYKQFAYESGPEFQDFPSWAARNPIAPPPAIVQRAIAHEQQAQRGRCCAHGIMLDEPCSGCQGAAGEEPAAAVKVCSSECEAMRERNRELESDVRMYQMQLGDALGNRDMLRNRVHELETALAFAEREVARLQKKAGKR